MVPFWDVVHQEVLERRAEAGYAGSEPPGYEENEAANANPWDRLILSNALVPGVSAVKVSPKFLIDVKKAADQDGGVTVERGHEAARVDIAITVWTPKQWENLQRLLEQIWRRPGQKLVEKDKAKAISIFHPAAALWGVTAVLIESADSPEPASQPGAMVVRLRCLQYIVTNKQKVSGAVAGLSNVSPLVQKAREIVGAGGATAPPAKTPSQGPVLARPPVPPRTGGNGT